jgi:ribosomal protein S18 acetylase RimI-like enzyme
MSFRKKVRLWHTQLFMADTVRMFTEAWRLMTSRFPAPEIEDAGVITTCFANVPLLFFNLWIQQNPTVTEEEFRAMLSLAKVRAARCSQPTGGVLREDWLPSGWEVMAAQYELAPMLAMTGMEARDILPPRRSLPALEIRRVTDDATATDLANVNALAYEMQTGDFGCLHNMQLWHADTFAYVGYADGRAVSAAAALPVDGTVYIAMVATLPGEQGKGYADAVMRHAIAAGQQGMGTSVTTLHATDKGLPVYRSMGYEAGARFMLVGPAAHDSH